MYLGNDFSFEFFGLIMPPIDFDYLQFDKGNTGSPCCAKDQRCLHSSRLLPSLILQHRISELIAFYSIWHFIFHISLSNYCNILPLKARCSLRIYPFCPGHYYNRLVTCNSNFQPLPWWIVFQLKWIGLSILLICFVLFFLFFLLLFFYWHYKYFILNHHMT